MRTCRRDQGVDSVVKLRCACQKVSYTFLSSRRDTVIGSITSGMAVRSSWESCTKTFEKETSRTDGYPERGSKILNYGQCNVKISGDRSCRHLEISKLSRARLLLVEPKTNFPQWSVAQVDPIFCNTVIDHHPKLRSSGLTAAILTFEIARLNSPSTALHRLLAQFVNDPSISCREKNDRLHVRGNVVRLHRCRELPCEKRLFIFSLANLIC